MPGPANAQKAACWSPALSRLARLSDADAQHCDVLSIDLAEALECLALSGVARGIGCDLLPENFSA